MTTMVKCLLCNATRIKLVMKCGLTRNPLDPNYQICCGREEDRDSRHRLSKRQLGMPCYLEGFLDDFPMKFRSKLKEYK